VSRVQVIYLHLCVALTAATGAVFAWMKYGMTSSDPFAVVNHPLQPAMLSAHVVVAPLLVFAFGWIFSDHILPKYRLDRRKRPSGLWSMSAIVPMTLSGYLLQISTSDALRRAMAIAHWVASGLFVLAYLVHVLRLLRAPAAVRSAARGA